MNTEADIVERLRERSLELSGRSIDRGCQDSGISANLCDEAADLITKLRTERDAWKRAAEEGMASSVGAARDMRERMLSKLEDLYISDPKIHPMQIRHALMNVPTSTVVATHQTPQEAE